MMTRAIDWLWRKTDAITTWPSFAGLFLLVIVSVVLFARYGANYPRSSFDGQRCGISASDVQPILQDFEASGQLDRYFAQETQLDLVFPAIYGLCFAIAIVGLRPRTWHWLIAVPYGTALFDYCENVIYITLVRHYRATHQVWPALAVAASVASRLKWAFMLLLIPALVAAAVRRFR
jgi:hypothetical protein